VHLAFDEIRLAGAGSPQVTRRMVAALHDLLSIATGDRRRPLELQLELLREAVAGTHGNDRDAAMAMVPDGQGMGSVVLDLTSPDGRRASAQT
jgi:hypothetical protein